MKVEKQNELTIEEMKQCSGGKKNDSSNSFAIQEQNELESILSEMSVSMSQPECNDRIMM